MNLKNRHTLPFFSGFLSIALPMTLLVISTKLDAQVFDRVIYRTIEGTCNNIQDNDSRLWGASSQKFHREMTPVYNTEDIYNGMVYESMPNPRAVSNAIFSQVETTGNAANLSSFVFTWAQFLDHDITLVEEGHLELAPIPLPTDEPFFTIAIYFSRSAVAAGSVIF